MKFSCTQENLNRGLQLVSHIASRAATLPILNNVLLNAEPGRVELVATNLELGVRCTLRGKVETPGKFTVQSKLLADYVALLPNERVDVVLDGQTLNVTSPNASTAMRGMPAEEFPVIPTVKRDRSFTVSAEAFKSALGQTLFAAATDEARPEISGVLLTTEGKKLTMAATDSYRLAEQHLSLETEAPSLRVILPRRSLQELLRILGSGTLMVAIDENQALFVVDDVEITTRLIEGQYPDYQSIIPADFSTTVDVARTELITAVRQASLFGKQGIYDVTVAYDGESKLTVRAANAQAGEHETTIPVTGTGEAVTIVFNYRYLLDGLTGHTAETVVLQLGTPASPALFRAKGTADSLYLLMPIRQ